MAQESIRIGKAELSAFVGAIFEAVGLSKEHAGEWAKMLVWANLRGTDSHGIIRIPRYIDLVKAKSINAAPNIRIERKDGAAVVLEADRALYRAKAAGRNRVLAAGPEDRGLPDHFDVDPPTSLGALR